MQMKKNTITFLITELALALLAAFFISRMFLSEKPKQRVAVIVENSGEEKWNSFINGMKQAAATKNIHLIICNTDEIESAEEEENLIREQLENDVDAFIIQAAPGYEVLEVLEGTSTQVPIVLVEYDVLVPQANEDIHATSYFSRVMPDNYKLGYELGEEVLRDVGGDIKGMTIGMVAGIADTDRTKKLQRGFSDALADTGCEIIWQINAKRGKNIADGVRKNKPSDIMVVLDTEALEQICAESGEENIKDTLIYGIGNSMKSVYYLDEGRINDLMMTDDYSMGYDSVVEISRLLENKLHTGMNYTVDFGILHREDIFTEETEKVLFTYE